MSYNFTNGSEINGLCYNITSNCDGYKFWIDLELITVLLIIIMICLVAQTAYVFLSHIGLIKRRF